MTGTLELDTWIAPNEDPRAGVVTIQAVDASTGAEIPIIVDATGHRIYSGPLTFSLAGGTARKELPPTDDTSLNPTGFVWRVRMTLDDGTTIDQMVELPDGQTVHLTGELDPPSTAPTYITRVNQAAGYATAAAGSASGAAASATTATQRAAAALTAQTAAETAETGALAAQSGAEAAESQAEDQAAAAGTSAGQAASSASAAQTARTGAETARDAAAGSASTAATAGASAGSTAGASAGGTAASSYVAAQKGAANGIAGLDGSQKLPDANVPDRLTATSLNNAYAGLDTLAPLTRPVRPTYTLISTFQSGHGWSDQGGTTGGAVADDTTVYELGTQSYKVTVPAAAGAARTVRKTGLTAFDPTGKNFAILLRVDAPTALGDIILTLDKDGTFANFTQYRPIYGSTNVDSGTLRANEWQWVHFTKAEQSGVTGTGVGTSATTWQLRVNGGTTSIINVWFNALGYYTPPTSYPNGVVSFACDDSYASQYTRLAPQLDKYGYACTAFNIVDTVDSDASHMTTAQLNDLHDYHGWEIAAHAYRLANHNLTNGFRDLTEAQLETEMQGLRAWTARYGWRGSDLFAYPKGMENTLVRKVVGKYFSFGRTVVRQPYQATRVGAPLRVRAYSLDSAATTAATITALIDSAYTNGWWLIITLHDVTASGASLATEWDVSKVTTVVDYCNTKGIPVKTIGEVLTAA